MKGDLNKPADKAPQFFYHLGDVVYFNGQIADYYDQFYDHTTTTTSRSSRPGKSRRLILTLPIRSKPLDGWVRYFLGLEPRVNPEAHDAPRVTMSLPNVYFTLNCHIRNHRWHVH